MDINMVCKAAVKAGASDIHIKVGHPPLVRINGEIKPIRGAPKVTNEIASRMARGLMSPRHVDTFKRSPDVDLAHEVPGLARCRKTLTRKRGVVGLVLRTIPSKVQTLDELGMPSAIKRLAQEQRGLVLVTGTTGSGKSTTLAGIIEEINRSYPHHILTIEDPVEFAFQDKLSIVNQREIGADSEDWERALRAALRQDPDVILIGELRDKVTMEIALSAAETGHLVLGTLHTLNAPEAINRIVDFFEPHHQHQVRHQLAGILRGIVSQRLVPGAKGGRVAALEIMLNTGVITECIEDLSRTKEIIDQLSQCTAQYGTQTFDQALYWHFKAGRITQEDALRYAGNPDDLQLRLSGIASDEWVEPE